MASSYTTGVPSTTPYTVTVVGTDSLTMSLSGPTGPTGPTGATGAAGTINTSTSTTLNGYIYGNGTTIAGATAATSAATANTLVLRSSTGNASFNQILLYDPSEDISLGVFVNGFQFTVGSVGSFNVVGQLSLGEYIWQFPSENGNVAITNKSSIQSWSGTQTFSGAMAITNATDSVSSSTGALVVSGGVGIGGAVNVGGASSFTSTTRPTAPNVTGTPAANSLITLGDANTRYSRVQDATVATIEQTGTNTTTYVDSTQGQLTLAVGTYIIETWQQVEGTGANPSGCSAKTKLRWTGTATASGLRFMAGGSTASPYNSNVAPVMAQNGARVFDTEVLYNYSTNYGGINHLRFKFVVTVAGTLYIQFAPAAAVASQLCSLHAGSFLRATQIA